MQILGCGGVHVALEGISEPTAVHFKTTTFPVDSLLYWTMRQIQISIQHNFPIPP